MSIQPITQEYIAQDPDYCGGQPRIINTRMPVAAIAQMYLEMKQSLEDIATKYHLSLAAVHGAMAYYDDHRESIELHRQETDQIIQQMKLDTPLSPFQARWTQIVDER